jgi:hypothetical protein
MKKISHRRASSRPRASVHAPSPPSPRPRVRWRQAALDLARCCIFALKFDKHMARGNGQVVKLVPGKPPEPIGPWQDKFFDALDAIGLVLDRKAYYAACEPGRRRLAKR